VTPSRNDIETTSPGVACCPVCATVFTRVRRQRYCSPACRQAGWRARNAPDPIKAVAEVAAPRPHRPITVYECPDCEGRYLGEQWCPDCSRPCRRIGPGAACPNCEHPIALEDLVDAWR
jgi:hypothetical protein